MFNSDSCPDCFWKKNRFIIFKETTIVPIKSVLYSIYFYGLKSLSIITWFVRTTAILFLYAISFRFWHIPYRTPIHNMQYTIFSRIACLIVLSFYWEKFKSEFRLFFIDAYYEVYCIVIFFWFRLSLIIKKRFCTDFFSQYFFNIFHILIIPVLNYVWRFRLFYLVRQNVPWFYPHRKRVCSYVGNELLYIKIRTTIGLSCQSILQLQFWFDCITNLGY